MKKVNIIIEVTLDENTSYTAQDIIDHVNLEYLNQAFDLHGIENLVVSEEAPLKEKMNYSSIHKAIAQFHSELESLL